MIVILGAGGLARELRDLLVALGESATFVADREFCSGDTRDFEWLAANIPYEVVCGVGSPELRKRFVAVARSLGCHFRAALVHPSAIIGSFVCLGEGVFVGAKSVLTTGIRVGDHVGVNYGCTIGHDAEIGAFSMILPGANISGNVRIGEGVLVGANACVIEKVTIGAGASVGAGAAVIEDVPAGATVVGVPGRVVRSRS